MEPNAMKKLILTATYFLTLSTAQVAQALPIWAEAIAQSQCEYLAMGFGFLESTEQALRDNSHWYEQFTYNKEISAKAIALAGRRLCPALIDRALTAPKSPQTQPQFKNQQSL